MIYGQPWIGISFFPENGKMVSVKVKWKLNCYIHSSDDAAYAAVLGTVDGGSVSAFAGCVVVAALCTVK